jgi:hypothetical protein
MSTNSAWVEWMTSLTRGGSRQTYAATLPPDRFYCLLDDLPLHLIPGRSRGVTRAPNDEPLFLNPDCTICRGNQLPDDLAGQKPRLRGFALQGTIAWVRDPFDGLQPFWLGTKLEEVVQNLTPGEPAPATLADEVRNLLYGAGILAGRDDARKSARSWETEAEKAATLFQQKGYAPVAELIHPFHVAGLRRYYRYLIRTGKISLGDRQSARRYVAYNDSVARFFHQQIAKKFSAIAGESVRPSYVYLASYLDGAVLEKHTDREQCEFSITFCLDFSPEPGWATSWPIQLDTPNGTVKVYQSLGDGLAYRGTRLPHYRDRLGEGLTSTSIFFHYVGEDFEGSLA